MSRWCLQARLRGRHCPLALHTQVRGAVVTEGAEPTSSFPERCQLSVQNPRQRLRPASPADHLAGNTHPKDRLEPASNPEPSTTWAPGYCLERQGPREAAEAAAFAAVCVGAEATTSASRGLKTHSHSMAPFQKVSVNTRGLLISLSL